MKINKLILLLLVVLVLPCAQAINVDSCGTLSIDGGIYYLTADIINSSENVCIYITASNITFDGKGHIIGHIIGIDENYAIAVSNYPYNVLNVTVKNLKIIDWMIGIYYQNSHYGYIYNNLINSSTYMGIYFETSAHNTVYNNYFNNSLNIIDEYSNNILNTTKIISSNIIGGIYTSGNYWAEPDGTGYSEDCIDLNYNGICDFPYYEEEGMIDYFPLVLVETESEIEGITTNKLLTIIVFSNVFIVIFILYKELVK